MTTLTWLPKSDSRRSHNHGQTDGSGSGVDVLGMDVLGLDVPGMEMSPESRNRGGSPSDDDEEYDYYDSYYDEAGSGYGSGDNIPKETPIAKGGKYWPIRCLRYQFSSY